MKTIFLRDTESETWVEKTEADSLIGDWGKNGRIIRTPEEHAALYECDPTDEEISTALAQLKPIKGDGEDKS